MGDNHEALDRGSIVELYHLFDTKKWLPFLFVIVLMLVAPGLTQGSYAPPIGIPAPAFGIDETHTMYAGQTYAAGGFVYKDAGNGPYTHYIDNTDPNCTNTGNEYGDATTPRCSVPTRTFNIPAGSVIELHGGPYDHGGWAGWIANGDVQHPVFIRGVGVDSAKIQMLNTQLRIAGEYLILENLDLYIGSYVYIDFAWDPLGRSSHIALRANEIHKPLGMIDGTHGIVAIGNDIVVYNNYIHDNWRSDTQDAHGVVAGEGANRVWILDNELSGNSGYGVETCPRCDPGPKFVYIGRNDIHGNREIGIGLKYVMDAIISQNKIHDYLDTASGEGTCIVIGADGPSTRVWAIFNEMYDCPYGVRVEESNSNAWIVGNVMHRQSLSGVNLEKSVVDTVYVVNNTFNAVNQVISQTWRDEFKVLTYDNIISNIVDVPVNLEDSVVADVSEVSRNVFFQNGNPFTIRWGAIIEEFTTTSDMASFVGGVDNIVEDPLFTNLSANDFSLQQNSPAVDVGTESDVYQTFQDLYGLDIRVDFNGTPRPQGMAWDRGAYEFTPPPAPEVPPSQFPWWPTFIQAIIVNGQR